MPKRMYQRRNWWQMYRFRTAAQVISPRWAEYQYFRAQWCGTIFKNTKGLQRFAFGMLLEAAIDADGCAKVSNSQIKLWIFSQFTTPAWRQVSKPTAKLLESLPKYTLSKWRQSYCGEIYVHYLTPRRYPAWNYVSWIVKKLIQLKAICLWLISVI